jgi:hypothetical protein
MSAPTTFINRVSTKDATPNVSKFKISGIPGYTTASILWSFSVGSLALRPGVGIRPGTGVRIQPEGPEVGAPSGPLPGFVPSEDPHVAVIRVVEGVNRLATPLLNLGAVCGIDRCGACKPLKIEARSGVRTFAVERVQIPEASGDITFTIFTLFESEGWV